MNVRLEELFYLLSSEVADTNRPHFALGDQCLHRSPCILGWDVYHVD